MAPGAIVHKMFPIGHGSLAKWARRILAPPLMRTMWGVDRIDKNGMHVPFVRLGDGFHDMKSLDMVAPTTQVQKALSVSPNLCPEGLTKRINHTLHKTMLFVEVESDAL